MSEVPNGTFPDTGAVYVDPNPAPVTPTVPPPGPDSPVPPSAALSQALMAAMSPNGPPQNNNVPPSTGGGLDLSTGGSGLIHAIAQALGGGTDPTDPTSNEALGQFGLTPSANPSPQPQSANTDLAGGVKLPGWANIALKLASMAPGFYGLPATLANAGMAANNVVAGNRIRGNFGLEPTGPLSFLSGVLGLNNRGDTQGNATIADPGEAKNPYNGSAPAITQGGMYENSPFGFLARILGGFGVGDGYFDPSTSYTVQEAVDHNVNSPTTAGATMANALKIAAGDNNMGGGVPAGNFNGGYGSKVANTGQGMSAKDLAANGLMYDPTTGGFVKNGNDRSSLGGGTMANPGGGTLGAGQAGNGGLANGLGAADPY